MNKHRDTILGVCFFGLLASCAFAILVVLLYQSSVYLKMKCTP